MPTGQEAPWRGSRMTRTSRAKYLPPNCAPMPVCCASVSTFCSSARSRKARPCASPVVGRVSRYLVEASFTVLRHVSALVPPMTKVEVIGRAGGGAEIPSCPPKNFSRLLG
jgi:hypothetical protein